MSTSNSTSPARRSKGFRRAAALVEPRIKRASSARGFAVSRVLTHWADMVGADLARMARPVEVTYGRGKGGATLTLLVAGAEAPLVEMEKERIREKVNSCYGYNAISKIRITQTSAASPSAAAPEPRPVKTPPAPSPEAKATAADVANPELKAALEQLGAHIFSHQTQQQRSDQ
ncbi:MAG: DUF721 domain-containing protein [Pseudomonadota bacterium]